MQLDAMDTSVPIVDPGLAHSQRVARWTAILAGAAALAGLGLTLGLLGSQTTWGRSWRYYGRSMFQTSFVAIAGTGVPVLIGLVLGSLARGMGRGLGLLMGGISGQIGLGVACAVSAYPLARLLRSGGGDSYGFILTLLLCLVIATLPFMLILGAVYARRCHPDSPTPRAVGGVACAFGLLFVMACSVGLVQLAPRVWWRGSAQAGIWFWILVGVELMAGACLALAMVTLMRERYSNALRFLTLRLAQLLGLVVLGAIVAMILCFPRGWGRSPGWFVGVLGGLWTAGFALAHMCVVGVGEMMVQTIQPERSGA
jgi:hypothetical protein